MARSRHRILSILITVDLKELSMSLKPDSQEKFFMISNTLVLDLRETLHQMIANMNDYRIQVQKFCSAIVPLKDSLVYFSREKIVTE